MMLRGLFVAAMVALLALPAYTEALGEDDTGRQAPSMGRGLYLGAFGGGGMSSHNRVIQNGTAFLSSGALSVSATGNAADSAAMVGGLHLGYEWAGWRLGEERSDWGLLPAAELEAYYLGNTRSAQLENLTPRITEHTFGTTFPMNMGVFLSNAVLTVHTPYKIHPYAGIGVGAAYVSVSGAESIQLNPAEPGINHFNSNVNASSWALAAQLKGGFRADIARGWWLFTEYRMLYVGPTNYTFGNTVYPTHSQTTQWNVTLGTTYYSIGVVGVGFNFDSVGSTLDQ